ncbi:MAG: CHASE domain-containing protein [Pseudomonadota bacterium]
MLPTTEQKSIDSATAHVATTTAGGHAFDRASRLGVLHWAVLAVALITTAAASWLSREQAIANADSQFARAAERAVEQVRFRMAKYETALRAGVAAVHASPQQPTREQWRTFARQLAIDETYPGIAGIGLIIAVPRDELDLHIERYSQDRDAYAPYPEHAQDTLFPIVFIEPESRNAEAIGLDMAHESSRFRATEQARVTGQTQITAPIQLVQDDVGQVGFLMLRPFFNRGVTAHWDAPAGALLGFVYAPFNAQELLVGTLGREYRDVDIRLMDGDQALFDEWPDSVTPGSRSISIPLQIFGRTWSFEVQSDRYPAATDTAIVILILGIGIGAVLLLMFLGMARVNRRSFSHIENVSEAHGNLSSALATANTALGDFAHAASQQLRAPLRGIVGLTEWIREDITAINDSEVVQRLVPTLEHVNTISKRAKRMESLINSILSYAEVGSQPQSLETVDAAALCAAVQESVDVPDGVLCIQSAPEMLRLDLSRIIQVLRELIDNAIRHHESHDKVKVQVSIDEDEQHYRFTVTDNGPGIDPSYIQSAFQSFTSFQPPEQTRTSGLGLALAKKVTESVGGSITVSNVATGGTCAEVQWPKSTLTERTGVAA